MSDSAFSRRTLLARRRRCCPLLGAGGLSACGYGTSRAPATRPRPTLRWHCPTYIPYTGLKPDLPGHRAGRRPRLPQLPQDNPKSVPRSPAKARR